MIRRIITGRSNPLLADRIVSALQETPTVYEVETFPDGELYVRIDADLNRSEVFVIQGTGPPVSENLVELMLLGDACLRAGAVRITAVLPYFGYARQDRRTQDGEAVGARMVADMIARYYHRILTVDIHNPAIEGFFTVSLSHLTAVPLLAEAMRGIIPRGAVIVAPDLGAAKLARRYADLLDLPSAYIHKLRRSGEEVEALYLTGSVRDRTPVIVDDMISTGGTVAAAIKVLLEEKCKPEIYVAASHGLFSGNAGERLAPFPIKRIFVSDTLPGPSEKSIPLETVSIAKLIGRWVEAVTGGVKAGHGEP